MGNLTGFAYHLREQFSDTHVHAGVPQNHESLCIQRGAYYPQTPNNHPLLAQYTSPRSADPAGIRPCRHPYICTDNLKLPYRTYQPAKSVWWQQTDSTA
eukprot:10226-Eustigmatos_ZCMA.PRE.1